MNENLYSIQLEQSVISTLLTVYTGVDEQIGKLTPEHFYAGQHNIIFKHIKELHSSGKCHDVVFVWDSIKVNANDSKIVNEKFLIDLMSDAPSTAYLVGQHADKLIEHKRRRDLFSAGERIVAIASDTTQFSTDTAISRAESVLSGVDAKSDIGNLHNAFDLSVGLYENLMQRMEDRKNGVEKIEGVSTGFKVLDEKIGLLAKGDLVYIGARPSMGKTALAQDIFLNVSFFQQLPVVFHSIEMKKEKIMQRIISSLASVESKHIRDAEIPDNKWHDISQASLMLQKAKVLIDDSSDVTLSDIRRNCRKIKADHGLVGAVFIDYLTLIRSQEKKEGRNDLEIGAISKGLKKIAKEFDCPVICLAQLNRSLEKRPDKRPMLSDLRESGSVEEDADVVLFIYRDEYYNKQSKDMGTAEIIAAKVRDGEVGTVRLATELQYSRFVELDMDYYRSQADGI